MFMWDLSSFRPASCGREAENWLSALGGVWGKREGGRGSGVDGDERRGRWKEGVRGGEGL